MNESAITQWASVLFNHIRRHEVTGELHPFICRVIDIRATLKIIDSRCNDILATCHE